VGGDRRQQRRAGTHDDLDDASSNDDDDERLVHADNERLVHDDDDGSHDCHHGGAQHRCPCGAASGALHWLSQLRPEGLREGYVGTRRLWACVLVGLALAPGCGSAHHATSPHRGATAPGTTTVAVDPRAQTATVAEVRGAGIDVFHAPGAPTPWMRLASPNEDGAPRVFLVAGRHGDWLRVLLPVRPNGTSGWIRATEVVLSENRYRILIELGAHRIRVWRGSDIVDDEPVGVGRGNTPTPGGQYYLTELLEQPDPTGPYGPYAYGISGYSNVLRTFAGADGVIGLHGTNDPGGLGHDVSHGCIRMSNAGINKLAKELPLGTPVVIAA